MMKIEIFEVFNLYEWLPPYGENRVIYSSFDNSLKLEIVFDGENEEEKKEILFKNVVWFSVSTFPGAHADLVSFPEYKNISSLVELVGSDLCKYWEIYFQNSVKFHHYQVYFLSANKRIQVVCEKLSLDK